ncbi:hypothetical protein [Pseudomonas sp. H1h]|uniref:hypothetical protein n=1 Tax=Pseudomonas sp. H1h TaxID=1397280 RepID=UPI00046A7B01|nr:hypothetical protein [Pseudomonas sp. H1h]
MFPAGAICNDWGQGIDVYFQQADAKRALKVSGRGDGIDVLSYGDSMVAMTLNWATCEPASTTSRPPMVRFTICPQAAMRLPCLADLLSLSSDVYEGMGPQSTHPFFLGE